jgi:hypothetical protein
MMRNSIFQLTPSLTGAYALSVALRERPRKTEFTARHDVPVASQERRRDHCSTTGLAGHATAGAF